MSIVWYPGKNNALAINIDFTKKPLTEIDSGFKFIVRKFALQ